MRAVARLGCDRPGSSRSARLVAAGLLYWKPLHAYLHTRDVLDRRQAEVAKLERQQQQLEQRIETVDSGHVLVREARRLGLVEAGERLSSSAASRAWRKKH